VTVAEYYAAHLKAQREMLRERVARARERAVKEREARRKRSCESEGEEEEEEEKGDAEQMGKESDAFVADEEGSKVTKRPNVFGRLKSYLGRRVFVKCRKGA